MTYWNRCLILTILLIFSTLALGVQLSPSHQGGSIFLPLYSAENGNGSAITISNHGGDTSAVKVLFLDQAGKAISGFNLYLPPMDSWAAFISKDQGQVKISIPDSSCTVPYLFESTDPSAELNLPSVGQILITDMGEVIRDAQIALQIDHETLLPRDCQLINDNWAPEGIWSTEPNTDIRPPVENLKGELQIINVQEGTVFTVPGLALIDFSDTSMHTKPTDLTPDLSWVNSADSQFENGARSFVASSSGQMIEDDWSDPVDAISALLATRNMISSYTAESELGATAEWVLSSPTLNFYVGGVGSKDFSSAKVSYRSTDRNTKRRFDCVPPIVLAPPCPPDGEITSVEQLFAIGSNTESQFGLSNFFGKEDHFNALVDAGQLEIGLNNYRLNLIGQSGVEYFGLPVYAFGVQKYINGLLLGMDGQTVSANYRTHIEITLDKFNKEQ